MATSAVIQAEKEAIEEEEKQKDEINPTAAATATAIANSAPSSLLPGYSNDFGDIIKYGIRRFTNNIFNRSFNPYQARMSAYAALPAYLNLATKTKLPLSRIIRISTRIGLSVPEIIKAAEQRTKSIQNPTEKFREAFNFALNSLGNTTKKKLRGIPKKQKDEISKMTQLYVYNQTFNPNLEKEKHKRKLVGAGKLPDPRVPFTDWLTYNWDVAGLEGGGEWWDNVKQRFSNAVDYVKSRPWVGSLLNTTGQALQTAGLYYTQQGLGNPFDETGIDFGSIAAGIGLNALGNTIDSHSRYLNSYMSTKRIADIGRQLRAGKINDAEADVAYQDERTRFNEWNDQIQQAQHSGAVLRNMWNTHNVETQMYKNLKRQKEAADAEANAQWWDKIPLLSLVMAPKRRQEARDALFGVRPPEALSTSLRNIDLRSQQPTLNMVDPSILNKFLKKPEQPHGYQNKFMPVPVNAGPRGRALSTSVPPPLDFKPVGPKKVVVVPAKAKPKPVISKRGKTPTQNKRVTRKTTTATKIKTKPKSKRT